MSSAHASHGRILWGPPTLPAMLVVELGEASFFSQMPFRPGAGQGRPLHPSASRAQAKTPLFLNLKTMPARHCLPKKTERARMGWEPRFLGQHSSPPDRCRGDSVLPLTGTQSLLSLRGSGF